MIGRTNAVNIENSPREGAGIRKHFSERVNTQIEFPKPTFLVSPMKHFSLRIKYDICAKLEGIAL